MGYFWHLSIIGKWEEAKEQKAILDIRKSELPRSLSRLGKLEYDYARFLFWQDELREEEIEATKSQAEKGINSFVTRSIPRLHGKWLLEQGRYAEAISQLRNAAQLSRKKGRPSAGAESWLALAEFRSKSMSLPIARKVATRLARSKNISYRPLAELWLALDNQEKARKYAGEAYQWACADGEPYVHRYELEQSQLLLKRLGEEVPNLPDYDSNNSPLSKWEEEIRAVVPELKKRWENELKAKPHVYINIAAVDAAIKNASPLNSQAMPSYDFTNQPWHNQPFPMDESCSYQTLMRNDKVIDVAILVATPVELLQVVRLLKPLHDKEHILKIAYKQETYYLGIFGCFRTAVCKTMMGSDGVAGSMLVTNAIALVWKPRVIIMVGIAFGANREKQKPADVMVASSIYPYESQRINANEEPTLRNSMPITSTTLLNRFDNAHDWVFHRPDGTPVGKHIGRLFSGAKLIDDPKFKKKLLVHDTTAIGGEMEGAGVWAAAVRNFVDWILVKSVCDWADGSKDDTLQEMAAASAASLCHHVLSDAQALDGLSRPR